MRLLALLATLTIAGCSSSALAPGSNDLAGLDLATSAHDLASPPGVHDLSTPKADLAGPPPGEQCLSSCNHCQGVCCGSACCNAGEWCDATNSCRCGTQAGCTNGNICSTGPVRAGGSQCGNLCCGATSPCPL